MKKQSRPWCWLYRIVATFTLFLSYRLALVDAVKCRGGISLASTERILSFPRSFMAFLMNDRTGGMRSCFIQSATTRGAALVCTRHRYSSNSIRNNSRKLQLFGLHKIQPACHLSVPTFFPHSRSMTNINKMTTSYNNMIDGNSNVNIENNNELCTEYEAWVRRLYQTNLFHPVKLGLDNMEALHVALGRPMDSMTVIHIAGTNGKGSVAFKIAKTLEFLNLPSQHADEHKKRIQVGLFCSPHVASFRERMQVNGDLISEDEVVRFLPLIYRICKEQDIPATFFEITTALAFAYFDARKVDIAVLETGLGGRLDATNVIAEPALSVITSIGLDHMHILGNTIDQIAQEKGGIIKPGSPVLVGPHVPHHVLRSCAMERRASAYYECQDVIGPTITNLNDAAEGATPMDYDAENSRIAMAAVKLLQQSHKDLVGEIPDEIVLKGTAVRPPCRFELIQLDETLTVVLDVGHNPSAVVSLHRKLTISFPDRTFRVVAGFSADKDLGQCADAIRSIVQDDISRIHFVEAANLRAAKLEDLMSLPGFASAHHDWQDRSITRQVNKALGLAREQGDVVVICGSFFIMAEARECLGYDEPRDSAQISAVAGANFRHMQESFGNAERRRCN